MTLGNVTLNTLTGDANAVRGSEKLDGKELVANYTYGNLSLVWRAVLRDGSHYLRTELDLTANAQKQNFALVAHSFDMLLQLCVIVSDPLSLWYPHRM